MTLTELLIGVLNNVFALPQYLMHAIFVGAVTVSTIIFGSKIQETVKGPKTKRRRGKCKMQKGIGNAVLDGRGKVTVGHMFSMACIFLFVRAAVKIALWVSDSQYRRQS